MRKMLLGLALALTGCSTDEGPTATVEEAQARAVCDPVTAQSNASDILRSQLPQDDEPRCATACNADDGSREFLGVHGTCIADGSDCPTGLVVIYHGLAGCCRLMGDGPDELEFVPCE